MRIRGGSGVAMKKLHEFSFRIPEDVLYCSIADVAAVPVENVPEDAVYSFFGKSSIISKEARLGSSTLTFGYPSGICDSELNVPFVR
jgi:hypothetical protein